MPRTTMTTNYWTPAEPRDGLAVSQIFGVLRRAWLWIAVPTLVAAVGAGVFVQVVPPRFTGEAKVLLESREPGFAKTASERSEPNQPIDEQAVASQVQLAMSRDIARQAIRGLKLVGNPEFDPSAEEIGPVKSVLMLLGLVKNPAMGAPEDRVLDTYYDKLLVYPVGKSRILAVEFRSRDPELAAKGANTISELYIASLAAASVDTARYASTWLGTNIDALRGRVAEAEAKVEAFRARNGLIGLGGSANQPLSTQQLGELSSQLSHARTIKADLASRVKLLKDMIAEGRAFDIPDVANNELIRRTVESRMSLRAQLALESRTLLPQHPRIKELTAQVGDLESQIKAASERIVRTLENDARIAEARVASLQAAVDGQSDVVVKGNGSEVQLRALEREAKVQREQLESYLTRFREASARDGANAAPADARIVSRAVVPETPSFPKKLPTLAVATLLAFLLSAGGVIGRDLLKTPPAGGKAAARPERDEDANRVVADPERLSYPEPLPPEHRLDLCSAAPGSAVFENMLTARASAAPALARAISDEAAFDSSSEPKVGVSESAARQDLRAASDGNAIGHGSSKDRKPEPAEAEPASVTANGTAVEPVETVMVPSAAVQPAAQEALRGLDPEGPLPATAASHEESEFDVLIERMAADSRRGGRCVLVVETVRQAAGTREGGMAASLATVLSYRAATLNVDINGRTDGANGPGFSDLVAGKAEFPDVIQAVPGSRLHRVGCGLGEADVLLCEPEGVAISLNAMAQAYAWVICRLDATAGDPDEALLSGLSACMDTVVIASDASAQDAGLVALYRLAEEGGAGQILVAQDQRAAWADLQSAPGMELRLSA